MCRRSWHNSGYSNLKPHIAPLHTSLGTSATQMDHSRLRVRQTDTNHVGKKCVSRLWFTLLQPSTLPPYKNVHPGEHNLYNLMDYTMCAVLEAVWFSSPQQIAATSHCSGPLQTHQLHLGSVCSDYVFHRTLGIFQILQKNETYFLC
jgi:hypothetical protein